MRKSTEPFGELKCEEKGWSAGNKLGEQFIRKEAGGEVGSRSHRAVGTSLGSFSFIFLVTGTHTWLIF